MDISKYHLLAKIADYKNLTMAAKAMNYTQSTASHAIDTLEKELGLKLLQRTHAGTQLTPDGAVLLPSIRELIECDNRIHALAKSIVNMQTGDLKIGSFLTFIVSCLPPIISDFHKQYPNVRIEIYSGNGGYGDVERALQIGLIDCGFSCKPVPSGMEYIDLLDDPFCAVIPAGHPLAAIEGPVSFEQLETASFLSLPSDNNADITRICEQYHFNPHFVLMLPDDTSILAMVDAGLGCAILPHLFLKSYHHNAVVKEIIGNPKRTICFIRRANESIAPRVQALLSTTQNLFAAKGESGWLAP